MTSISIHVHITLGMHGLFFERHPSTLLLGLPFERFCDLAVYQSGGLSLPIADGSLQCTALCVCVSKLAGFHNSVVLGDCGGGLGSARKPPKGSSVQGCCGCIV